jgi:hypothetical protein
MPPLKAKEIWSLRIRLQMADIARHLALFNLTASYAAAIWSRCAFGTCIKAAWCPAARS